MKSIFAAQKARFGRIIVFAEKPGHATYFPANKPAGQRIAALKEVVRQLGTLGGTQEESDRDAQAATGTKEEVLESVWVDLVGMARVARALDDEHPTLPERFKTPDSKSEQAILDAAKAALHALTDPDHPADAAALVALFIDEGMPDDFVEDLQNDLDDATAANRAQDDHGGDRHEDTLAITRQVAIGVKLAEKLDAYAKNRFRSDAVLLGTWKTASHLEIRRVRRTTPTQTTSGN